jgi:hypothetical protein
MHDRFEAKQVSKRAAEKAKKGKAAADDGKTGNSKNEMKSAKFFSKLQEVAKDDAKRKDDKRKARQEGGKAGQAQHTNESTKRFKL